MRFVGRPVAGLWRSRRGDVTALDCEVAETAVSQGILPDTISTDRNNRDVGSVVPHDLPLIATRRVANGAVATGSLIWLFAQVVWSEVRQRRSHLRSIHRGFQTPAWRLTAARSVIESSTTIERRFSAASCAAAIQLLHRFLVPTQHLLILRRQVRRFHSIGHVRCRPGRHVNTSGRDSIRAPLVCHHLAFADD